MEIEINNNGKFSLEIQEDINNLLNPIKEKFENFNDIGFIRYKEFEDIIKKIDVNLEITRRTVGYYIEQGLLPPLQKIEGKKFGYYTKEHVYTYIFICILKKFINLKRVKKLIDEIDTENIDIQDCILSYFVNYNLAYKNLNEIYNKIEMTKSEMNVIKAIALISNINCYTEILNKQLKD